MGQPGAARLRGLRWILLGLGLIGASLALTAQPAQAGVTDQLASSTAKVTEAVHHAVHEASRTKATTKATTTVATRATAKAKSVARHVVRQAKPARVVRQLASKPVVKIIKRTQTERVAPVMRKVRATVHRAVERAVTSVKKPVKNLPKPVASPVVLPVVPASVAPVVDLPVRATAVVSTASSALRSSLALPVVAVVSTSPTDRVMPTLAPRHELAPGHRARAGASPESHPSTPLAPLSDPVPAPAPAGASSAATSAPGSASTKATLIDPTRTGADPSLDRMVGVAAGPWSLTRDPGFSPD